MKKSIILVLIFFASIGLFAQNELDAFRLSQVYYGGTARSMGMAGSFGALGGDLSTASTNPAGIGIFKHSEFNFTPSFMLSTAYSEFNGTQAYDDKFSLHLDNFGFVFSTTYQNQPIKAMNFAFGYNRSNNFKHAIMITGVNDKGSILDSWMLDANGVTPDNLNSFTTYPAFATWLIDTLNGNPLYYTNPLWWSLKPGEDVQYGETQTQYLQTSGGAGEYYGNFAFNLKDMLFGGITVGIPTFSFRSYKQYSESGYPDSTHLTSMTYEENLSDQGTGINVKAGLIFMPVKFVRIGASIQSPTYFGINDLFKTSVASHWDNADPDGNFDYDYTTEQNRYKFNLLTPMRATGSVAFILGKYALIDVDYEYVDYSMMRLSSSDEYTFIVENNAIRNVFQPTYNIHGGAELNFGYLRLRGGYAMFGNPYRNSTNIFNKSQITGGLGLYFETFYIDLAYVKTMNLYNMFFYNGYTDEPVPQVKLTDNIFNFTIGFKWE